MQITKCYRKLFTRLDKQCVGSRLEAMRECMLRQIYARIHCYE